jgi:hypothetical protein
MDLRHGDRMDATDDAKHIQQPDDHTDDYYDIQNLFDLPIHGNVGIDQPEQDSDDNQGDDDSYEWHIFLG